MLEMAGGAICLSTMGLKIGNCVCSADEWRRAVQYVRNNDRTAYLKQERGVNANVKRNQAGLSQ